MRFIKELKNSTVAAFVIIGLGLATTIFVGFFQYIMILIPFLGTDLILVTWKDYTVFCGGSIFGIIFLLTLEWLKILRIYFQPLEEKTNG